MKRDSSLMNKFLSSNDFPHWKFHKIDNLVDIQQQTFLDVKNWKVL